MNSQGFSPDQAAKSGLPPLLGPAPEREDRRGLVTYWSYFIFLAGLICTTSAPIFMRLSEIGPMAAGAWRMTLALPALLVLLKFESPQQRTALDRKDLMLLILSGLFFAGDLALWYSSVMLTSMASASFLANSAPVFVVLGAWLLFKDRPSGLFLMGLAVSVAGSAIMMAESLEISARNLTGDFLSVGGAAFYACYLLAVALSRKRVSTMTLMVVSTASAAAALWVLALLVEPAALWPETAHGWLIVAGMALLTHVAGQTLIALSLGTVPARFSALILLLQPAIPTLFAWLLFNESLSSMQVVGAAGIVIGLALARPRARV